MMEGGAGATHGRDLDLILETYKGDRPPLKQKEEVRRRREPAEESFVNSKTILFVLMVVVVLISCIVANMYMLK